MQLTPRELEVATLVAEGLTNAEIAMRLSLAPGTVANHVASILRHFDLPSRVNVATHFATLRASTSAADFGVNSVHAFSKR